MHRFPNPSSVFRFRIAAFLFIVRVLLPAGGIPLLFWAILVDDRELLFVAVYVLVATPVVAVLQWIVAARVRCPLCISPPMLSRACSKNRKARRLFGSYRLRVAFAALFLGHFRCQYCGEPTQMKPRKRGDEGEA